MKTLLTLQLANGVDVVQARRRARELAVALGFGEQDQVRIATAVSEIARNAVEYGQSGEVRFALVDLPRHGLQVEVDDRGPGFSDLAAVLDGRYRSPHGMGVGLIGSRRLMDEFDVSSEPGRGARVRMAKYLPHNLPPKLGALPPGVRIGPAEIQAELRLADDQLVRALVEVSRREDELLRVNRELEETNRGVVALYAELDEKAASLKRAGELKTRFISNMTHEFRTPVNALMSLSDMLLEELDGPLNAEQKRQVGYLRRAAQSLLELVNDLLDLAKVEAGKVDARPAPASVGEIMATLRGMLRGPAAQNPAVQLVVEDPTPDIQCVTDEAKVSQILRNLVSNALKFTDAGEVRVTAALAGERLVFMVTDTGVGIRPEDQARIFDEFEQVEGPSQRRHRGTGLGLPLSRSLAELMHGTLTLASEAGLGSTFRLELPRDLSAHDRRAGGVAGDDESVDPERVPVLVLQGDVPTRRLVTEALAGDKIQIFTASSLAGARALLARVTPKLVVMDVLLPDENAWGFITELRQNAATRHARIAVLTDVANEAKALELGANAFALKPAETAWLRAQGEGLGQALHSRAIVIDDDEIARYLSTSLLGGFGFAAEEFAEGASGVERARAAPPDVILLDLRMPELDGFAVLERLAERPETARVPVILQTSAVLTMAERERLERRVVAVLAKHSGSREEAAARLKDALIKAGVAR